jgi:hypothetical protein
MKHRQMAWRTRGVGDGLHDPRIGADGKHEARTEGMRRAEQIAEIDGLGDSLHANCEISAVSGQGFHNRFMP